MAKEIPQNCANGDGPVAPTDRVLVLNSNNVEQWWHPGCWDNLANRPPP